MSLVHFLAMGRTFKGIASKPRRYRMSDISRLPKFNESAPGSRSPQPPVIESLFCRTFEPPQASPLPPVAERFRLPERPEVTDEERPLNRAIASESGENRNGNCHSQFDTDSDVADSDHTLQCDLSSDQIRVVCNDLEEDDVEVVSPRRISRPVRSRTGDEASIWSRLSARLFLRTS